VDEAKYLNEEEQKIEDDDGALMLFSK